MQSSYSSTFIAPLPPPLTPLTPLTLPPSGMSPENIHRHHQHHHHYSEETSPSPPPHFSNKDTKVKKKSKPAKDSSQVLEKRRFQNRLAQRASRVRKAQHLKELEDEISKKNEVISQQRNVISRLQNENSKLRNYYFSGVPTPPTSLNTTFYDPHITTTSAPTSPLLFHPLTLSSTPSISSESSPSVSSIGLPVVGGGGGREWENTIGNGGPNAGLMKTATQFLVSQSTQQQQLEETQQSQLQQPPQQFLYHLQSSQLQSQVQPSPSIFQPSNPIFIPASIPQPLQLVLPTPSSSRKSSLAAPLPQIQTQSHYDSFSKSQSPETPSIVSLSSEDDENFLMMPTAGQSYLQPQMMQQQQEVGMNIEFRMGGEHGWMGMGVGMGAEMEV